MFLISSCSHLCPIHWSQVLRREGGCSWSSADMWCSNYIWVINNVNVWLILEVWWYNKILSNNQPFWCWNQNILEYLGQYCSTTWLLMPWLLASPGHQQPWYLSQYHGYWWPGDPRSQGTCNNFVGKNGSCSSTGKDFNYLRYLWVDCWEMAKNAIYVSRSI